MLSGPYFGPTFGLSSPILTEKAKSWTKKVKQIFFSTVDPLFQVDPSSVRRVPPEGWNKILEVLPLSRRTVDRVVQKDTLTEFDAQLFIRQAQADVRDVTERSVIKLNNRSKEALEEQEDVEKKKAEVERIKQEVYANHSNIMKMTQEQTKLRNELKQANALLTQARRDGVTRRALEREKLEAERKRRDENAVEGGALLIKKIKEKRHVAVGLALIYVISR